MTDFLAPYSIITNLLSKFSGVNSEFLNHGVSRTNSSMEIRGFIRNVDSQIKQTNITI